MEHELAVLGTIQGVCEGIVLRVALRGPPTLCCEPILDGHILSLPGCIRSEVLQRDLQDMHYMFHIMHYCSRVLLLISHLQYDLWLHLQARITEIDNKELFQVTWAKGNHLGALNSWQAGQLLYVQ